MGLALTGRHVTITTATEREWSLAYCLAEDGAVLPAHGGWQTAEFRCSGSKGTKEKPPTLLLGVLGVVVLYLGVNWVCLRFARPVGAGRNNRHRRDVQMALGQRVQMST